MAESADAQDLESCGQPCEFKSHYPHQNIFTDDESKMLKQSDEFNNTTAAKIEVSAMAVVMYGDKILTTNEIVYGKETLSLPKGHKEKGETISETAIRECFEETNIVLTKDNLIKELPSYFYEFLTPANELIRKTIVPFLFKVNEKGNPLPKEKRIVSVRWMDIDEFIDKCTYENVKEVVKNMPKV